MRRVGKLMYEWVGFDHLPGLLEQLAQDEANGACLGWYWLLCPLLVSAQLLPGAADAG